MPAARKAVATAFSEGFTHGVELDFENFYGSVRLDGLADLLRPLPTSVVEHVVWDVAMRDAPCLDGPVSSVADPTPSALTGLSLGAASSPIVGERIVSALLAVAQLPGTITYADNLFVMGRSEEEVSARIHQIMDGVALLDVGRLGLRVGFSLGYDLAKPFEFAKQQGQASEDGMSWKPSAAKCQQYQISALERPLTLEEIATAERRVRFWRRSYPDWAEGDAYEAEYLAGLAVRRFYHDRNASNLTSATHAVFVAYEAWGGSRQPYEFIPTEGDITREGWQRLAEALSQWFTTVDRRRQEASGAAYAAQ
jgi:hypothetical protein